MDGEDVEDSDEKKREGTKRLNVLHAVLSFR